MLRYISEHVLARNRLAFASFTVLVYIKILNFARIAWHYKTWVNQFHKALQSFWSFWRPIPTDRTGVTEPGLQAASLVLLLCPVVWGALILMLSCYKLFTFINIEIILASVSFLLSVSLFCLLWAPGKTGQMGTHTEPGSGSTRGFFLLSFFPLCCRCILSHYERLV